jgi:hypothetical protein
MERAREYRHPPAPSAFVAGLAGLAASWWTQRDLASGPHLGSLAALWGGAFLVAFAGVVVFTSRAARREGIPFWSPLAKDVVHSLWPPFVAAAALTVALAREGRLELVAPLWLLAYGVGGISAGAFASPIVRWLGAAFFVAGLAQLVHGLPPGCALGVTFGGFHLVYGVALLCLRGRDGR